MGAGRQTTIAILSFILILTSIILFVGALVNDLLYPELYEKSFEKSGVYDYADNALQGLQTGSFLVISDEGSKPVINGLLANTLSYIRSDTEELNLTLIINTTKLQDFFLEQINNLPTCQKNQDHLNLDNPCLPIGKQPSDYMKEFFDKNEINLLNTNVIDLTKVYGLKKGSPGRAQLEILRGYAAIYKKAMYIITLITIIFVILLLLLTMPSVSRFLKVLGINSIIIGLILFIPISLTSSKQQVSLQNNEIFSKMANSLISTLSSKAWHMSIGLVFMGIALIIVSIIVNRGHKEKQKAPQKAAK